MPAREENAHFTPELFRFLRQLDRNNNRPWFEKHKPRYLEHVHDPMLAFIGDFAAPLRKISRHIVADPRPNGGSLFRIYRDTRFSKDKRPYKTNAGAHFRHEMGRDAHCPGFYLHLGHDEVLGGGGIWHPDGPSLATIRRAIVADPAAWKRAKTRAAREGMELGGDSLKRPPRGFDPDHPLVEDLKLKDFYVGARFDEAAVCRADFVDRFAATCRAGAGLVRFVARALDVPF